MLSMSHDIAQKPDFPLWSVHCTAQGYSNLHSCFPVKVLYFVCIFLLFFLITQASKALASLHLWKGLATWVEMTIMPGEK